METTIISGAQFGDEGKGKVCYHLSKNSDISIRCSGGTNAEHTFMHNGSMLKFRILPIGIINGNIAIITGNVVINCTILLEEIKKAKSIIGDISGRLFISENADIILPKHREISKSNVNIGTIGHGVGPANADRRLRQGISLKAYYNNINEFLDISDKDKIALKKIKKYVCNTEKFLEKENSNNKKLKVLIEGNQGFLLDNLYGTYPYVTSSSLSSTAFLHGAGIAVNSLKRNVGVIRSYLSRFSVGPLVTRCTGDELNALRNAGNEYDVPTSRYERELFNYNKYGRKGRGLDCGWLDIVALKYAHYMNSYTEFYLNKLDVLSYLDEIPVCIGYEYKGKLFHTFYEWSYLKEDDCKPVYKMIKGWKKNIFGINSPEQLPSEAEDYIKCIEDMIEVPIRFVGTGPGIEETIDRAKE